MRGSQQAAFTLAECVLALAITALIGLTVVGVSVALSNAYDHGSDYSQSIHVGASAVRRLGSILREAKLVTAASESSLVIWAADANGNGKINRSEVTVLAYDPGERTLEALKVNYPSDMPAETRAALDVETDLAAITGGAGAVANDVANDAYAESTVLATDVTDFRVSVSPAAPMTDLVNLGVTIGQGACGIRLRSSVALRADETRYVGLSGGQYVLAISRPLQ